MAQLIAAASQAHSGDREATRAHIAKAISLIRELPRFEGACGYPLPNLKAPTPRGGLLAWQARRVRAHVDTNLTRRIPVQELAALLSLSPSHFCRAFKSTTGISPREYILRRRIELAKTLMLHGAEPLSSIAIRCGMCDQPHFTRSFHRIEGITPYQWRRHHRGSAVTNEAETAIPASDR